MYTCAMIKLDIKWTLEFLQFDLCKRTQGLIICYRWLDYLGTLCVGVAPPNLQTLEQWIQMIKKQSILY